MMKNLFIFTTAVTLSTSVLAGNMSENRDINAMHSQIKDKQSVEYILQNEDMQRMHRDMALSGMSEMGMEARLQMIGSAEGRAYHKAREKAEKNTAG